MGDYDQLKEELNEVADILQEFSSDIQPAVFRLLMVEYYDGDLPVAIDYQSSPSNSALDSALLSQTDDEADGGEAMEPETQESSDGPASFNEFVEGKEYTSHHEKCLLAVYYTTETLGKEEATDADVKQRYSDARWRPPKRLRQALNDAKNKKSWIESISDGNWVPSYEGKNVVKHDMEEDES